MEVYGHTVLHNDPTVAAAMRLVKNATSSIRGSSKRAATPVMTGEGAARFVTPCYHTVILSERFYLE